MMRIVEKLSDRLKDNWNQPAVTIAFLGDSVTQGCFELYRKSADSCETVFDQRSAYHAEVARILSMLYPNAPINIINAGVSGGNAAHGLERLERDVLAHKPDLTVVCFGLNDCHRGSENLGEYLDSLKHIFARLQEAQSEVIFMTPNMMATRVSYDMAMSSFAAIAEGACKVQNEGGLDLYLDAAKKLCEEQGVSVCDCYEKWKTLARCGVDVTDLLANKINHPTREMHRLFAVSLVETMMQ